MVLLLAACSPSPGGGGDTDQDTHDDGPKPYGLTARVDTVSCVVQTPVPGQPPLLSPLVSQTNCYANLAAHTPAAEFV
ncbi:MAG TPA: hypothetical protein VLC93_13010, partial [Myxococcota bacterium]|nr:hypothetical protein [Myxococcota bacterium]